MRVLYLVTEPVVPNSIMTVCKTAKETIKQLEDGVFDLLFIDTEEHARPVVKYLEEHPEDKPKRNIRVLESVSKSLDVAIRALYEQTTRQEGMILTFNRLYGAPDAATAPDTASREPTEARSAEA